ncbi:phosphoglycerate mutase-like protein [Lentinula detonsa]|uniref:Phosphoglycerate mutase-like protein n=1 Tax=Lentinula detonsa TaxID=2804962 RepID=A0A9W8P719_9AGAR|nr:phosphoglycerate mutase-like protein [Lentinula detonsa]
MIIYSPLLFLFGSTVPIVRAAFNPLQHSGSASPYFDAPTPPGIRSDTPVGCVVDQAAYFVRHGSYVVSSFLIPDIAAQESLSIPSRYPEPSSFTGWQNLFWKIQNATFIAHGPLSFLPSWVLPVDNVDHEPLFLSSTGAREAFDLGVELRKRYAFTAGGENFTAWSAGEQRVVDTTTYFLRGYLSDGNYLSDPSLNRGHLIVLPDSLTAEQAINLFNGTFADSLTPSASCSPYAIFSNNGSVASSTFRATYQNQTAARINTFLQGDLAFNATDIGVIQDLCGFGFEISGDRRFCDIFTDDEWLNYEYADDLNYYYGSGPGNPLSATTGYPWVKAIADLFEVGPYHTVPNGTLVPPPLIMGFSHDNNLPPLLSALKLWNDTVPSLTQRDTNPLRQFRSGHLVVFRGYLALERLSCTASQSSNESGIFHQAGILGGTIISMNQTRTARANSSFPVPQLYVRVRADYAPVPIPSCSSGPGRTCPLAQFMEMVNGPLATAAGDFMEVCGLENVTGPGVSGISGNGSSVKFLTTKGDGTEILLELN